MLSCVVVGAKSKRADVKMCWLMIAKVEVMLGLLSALAYVHHLGIVHRDVKCENILLEGNRAILSDFGISCFLSDPESMEKRVGSPGYASPEMLFLGGQLRGCGALDAKVSPGLRDKVGEAFATALGAELSLKIQIVGVQEIAHPTMGEGKEFDLLYTSKTPSGEAAIRKLHDQARQIQATVQEAIKKVTTAGTVQAWCSSTLDFYGPKAAKLPKGSKIKEIFGQLPPGRVKDDMACSILRSILASSHFASSAVPRFAVVFWIMTVLTASLFPSQLGNGAISVSITTSFNGQDVCSFQLPGGTLADLEKVLCDADGPMFWCYPWSHFLFYTESEPLMPLDLNLQVDAFHSLVIKRGDVEAFLDKFPDTGKFLEAMGSNKFDPHEISISAGPQQRDRRFLW
eukprot:s2902_g7.t1